MPVPFAFDFKNPDYLEVYDWRLERLKRIRENPEVLPQLKEFYRENPAQFIIDWGCTYDPRNIEIGLPATIPFILFPKQEDLVNFFMERWRSRTPGLIAKSRDMGVSWVLLALSATLCLFHDGLIAGFGSRKEEYVDKIGDHKSLFFKARKFIELLPAEFRGGWRSYKNSSHMLIRFPESGSTMTGEAGDNLGRGDRASFYTVDEAAWLMRPQLVEASLSATTNTRIDISTPHGPSNPFARKWFAGKIAKFTLHWTDDPRKDQAWYEKKCAEINDPIIIAQELDLDFYASLEGVIIPAIWVQASIDAHVKLKITPEGLRKASFDVADEGADLNASAGTHAFLLEALKSWSGKNSDLYYTTEKMFRFCDEFGYKLFEYDADGLGAGIRGDARKINEKRKADGLCHIEAVPFRGSGAVVDPTKEVFRRDPTDPIERGNGRKNEDYFENLKAQGWWALRQRFYSTYRAVMHGDVYDPSELISISSKLPELNTLLIELSQPTFTESKTGKITVDKKPDGAASPNLADAVMIAYAPKSQRRGMFDAPMAKKIIVSDSQYRRQFGRIRQ